MKVSLKRLIRITALQKANGDTAYRTRTVSTTEVTMVGMKIFIVAQR